MLSFKKFTIVCLGIFLGGLTYGFHTTIYNYNCIVPEQKELEIIKVNPGNTGYIFMGEEIEIFDLDLNNLREHVFYFNKQYLNSFIENSRRVLVDRYHEVKDYFIDLR